MSSPSTTKTTGISHPLSYKWTVVVVDSQNGPSVVSGLRTQELSSAKTSLGSVVASYGLSDLWDSPIEEVCRAVGVVSLPLAYRPITSADHYTPFKAPDGDAVINERARFSRLWSARS